MNIFFLDKSFRVEFVVFESSLLGNVYVLGTFTLVLEVGGEEMLFKTEKMPGVKAVAEKMPGVKAVAEKMPGVKAVADESWHVSKHDEELAMIERCLEERYEQARDEARKENAELRKENAELRKENGELREENGELREELLTMDQRVEKAHKEIKELREKLLTMEQNSLDIKNQFRVEAVSLHHENRCLREANAARIARQAEEHEHQIQVQKQQAQGLLDKWHISYRSEIQDLRTEVQKLRRHRNKDKKNIRKLVKEKNELQASIRQLEGLPAVIVAEPGADMVAEPGADTNLVFYAEAVSD